MTLRHMSCLYLLQENRILLIHKPHSRVFSTPLWTGVGGHFENAEMDDPAACLLREVWEETGLEASALRDLSLRYLTLRRKDDEIRQQYIFFAEAAQPLDTPPPCGEGRFEWVPLEDLPGLMMSFTNRQCLTHYYQTGCRDDLLYAGMVETPEEGSPRMRFAPLRDFSTDY